MKVKDFLLILICVLNCSTINEQFEDTVVAIMCICHSTQNLMFLSASLMGDALYFCCHMMSFVNANLPRYPFGIFMINPFGLLLGLSCDVKRLRVLNFPGISSFVSSSSNTYLLSFSNIPFPISASRPTQNLCIPLHGRTPTSSLLGLQALPFITACSLIYEVSWLSIQIQHHGEVIIKKSSL